MIADNKDVRSIIKLFLIAFVYAIVAMIVSREVIVPHMTSSIGGNFGGDPQYYNSIALKKVQEIKARGIMGFELRPEGQGPAGVASLLYLIWEDPYVVVIVNAILHALSVSIMVLVLMQWFPRRTSIIGTLPLAVSPYMIVWFSQINKDSFALAGGLLFTYGLLRLVGKEGEPQGKNSWLRSLPITVAGILLIWVVRPYVNQMLLPITGLIFGAVLLLRVRRGFDRSELIGLIIRGLFVLTCLGLLGEGAVSDQTLENFNHIEWLDQAGSQAESQSVASKCFASIDEKHWRNAQFLPDFVNIKLKAMMGQRCLIFTLLATQTNATTRSSIVDLNTLPQGAVEALAYFPHAALLGIFSPWPDRWGYVFNHIPSVFYIITPIEAIMLYVGLIGMSVWLIRRKSWTILIPITLSVVVMSIYGMATPYIGALYRYRFPWWMLLICMGVAATVEMVGGKIVISHNELKNAKVLE
jgi:hypothetical protein